MAVCHASGTPWVVLHVVFPITLAFNGLMLVCLFMFIPFFSIVWVLLSVVPLSGSHVGMSRGRLYFMGSGLLEVQRAAG